jgi:hypothetical protein
VAIAEADPADPRRQALELNTILGQVEPAMQVRIVGMSSFTFASVRWMSSGSPDRAAQRNGPTPRQNSGRT